MFIKIKNNDFFQSVIKRVKSVMRSALTLFNFLLSVFRSDSMKKSPRTVKMLVSFSFLMVLVFIFSGSDPQSCYQDINFEHPPKPLSSMYYNINRDSHALSEEVSQCIIQELGVNDVENQDEKVALIQDFVRTIISDDTSDNEGMKHSLVTLQSETGDCEDQSNLMANLFHAANIDYAVIRRMPTPEVSGHLALAYKSENKVPDFQLLSMADSMDSDIDEKSYRYKCYNNIYSKPLCLSY